MDYFGKRLATCSSDRTVKIFEVSEDQQTLVATLTGYINNDSCSRVTTEFVV